MVTKKTVNTISEFYNTAETITLPLTKLEVKYIKPDAIQASTFQSFLVDSVSKIKLTPNEINSLTYIQLREKVTTLFSELTTEEVTNLFSEMILVEVDKLLEVIVDCFPEVTTPRLLKSTVLDDMVKILFSTVFNQ